MVAVDVDDKVDLEQMFDEDVPCANPVCQSAAEWALKNRCCGLQVCVCNACFSRLMLKIAASQVSELSLHCARCSAHLAVSDVSWWQL